MCSNLLRQNRETDKEQDEDYVEEEFQLARAKLDRNDEGVRKALGRGNCRTNV